MTELTRYQKYTLDSVNDSELTYVATLQKNQKIYGSVANQGLYKEVKKIDDAILNKLDKETSIKRIYTDEWL